MDDQKLNTPINEPKSTETPQANSLTPEKHSLKFSNKKALIFTGIILVVLVSFALALVLFIIPSVQTNKYLKEAEPITKNLESEIGSFKKDNFMAAKNVTSSMEEAKNVLEDHISDLNSTKKNVSTLKDEYESLKPPKKFHPLDEKIDQAFELSNAILEKYDRTLVFRKAVINAYGDRLPRELENYRAIYYRGGDRTNFILQTDNIAQLANDAIVKMNNIDVADDEKEYFDLKLKYLQDVKSTFERLNLYYRTEKVDSVNGEVINLTNKTNATNQKISAAINNYVEKSSIADDLKKLQELIDEIQVDFP